MRFLTALMITWTTAMAGAFAATPGQPTDGHLGLQPAVTPISQDITFFHDLILMPIITVVTLFVMGLLVWVIFRYNRKANPTPGKSTHNTLLEVIWTGIPIVILIVISIWSFPLLYLQDETPEGDFVIKATGYQWNWSYEYPDQGVGEYFSNMIADEDLQPGQLRNLSVDYPVVVPVGATVVLQVTAADVIHNWAMPAFGTKMDAIPGRINEAWFQVEQEGVYYGQCSELCGLRHAFMPIEVHAVSQDVFDAWVALKADDPFSEDANQLIADYQAARNTRLAQLN
ncbi:cytochrome c oxidase subunit II [Maricaulis sp. D1M11]|uniref:cytochrome c oxidase subunit II n=1 Tax=Maricaulis sp. D1M11 TaxID=3076117 RepID=UPI0039B430C7